MGPVPWRAVAATRSAADRFSCTGNADRQHLHPAVLVISRTSAEDMQLDHGRNVDDVNVEVEVGVEVEVEGRV